MDIDKLYRVVFNAFKRVSNHFVVKPVKDFNVENRAYKAIEKSKAAPWHETTKNVIEKIKKENVSEELHKRNEVLLDRLRSVKVGSLDQHEKSTSQESDRKLPQERFGADLPYVFYKPEKVLGKITVFEALEILISHKKENTQPATVAEDYNIPEQDVENLFKYFDVYRAFNKNKEEIELYISMQEENNQIESKTDPSPTKKMIEKK